MLVSAQKKWFNATVKGFTLIELMVVVAIIAFLVATTLPMYQNYVNRSRTQEIYILLPQIARNEAAYYEVNREFIEVGPTNIPPSPTAVVADFSGDNWPEINFKSTEAVLFGYRGYLSGGNFIAEAQGDQDGDGDVSLFSIPLSIDSDNRLQVGGITLFDELE